MANASRNAAPDMRPSPSSTSAQSLNSSTSRTPLNNNSPPTNDSAATTEDHTTYFLLDIEDEPPEDHVSQKSSKHSTCRRSSTTSDSSDSSVSAQVVIDHGSSAPRRFDKHIASHVFRSDNEESESDYAYSYRTTPPGMAEHAHHDEEHDDTKDDRRIPSSSIAAATSPRQETGFSNHDIDAVRKSEVVPMDEAPGSPSTTCPGGLTVYTEEEEDLMEQVPSWDHERIRHETENDNSPYDAGDESADPSRITHRENRKPRKRPHHHRLLQEDLHSHSWSRRESAHDQRKTGLSSDEALR